MTLNVAWFVVPEGLVGVFQKLLISRDFHKLPPLVYSDWSEKKKISRSVGPGSEEDG